MNKIINIVILKIRFYWDILLRIDKKTFMNDSEKMVSLEKIDRNKNTGAETTVELANNSAPNSNTATESESNETGLTHWIERFQLIKEIIINTVFLSIVGSIIFVFCYEWQREPVIIEPFLVPESLAQQGYTGEVLANRLMDQLSAHREDAYNRLPDDQKYLFPVEVTNSDLTDSLKVDIPDTGMSLNIIIQYIRRMRGMETRINGDLVGDKDNFELSLRVKGKTKIVKGNLNVLNNNLSILADHVIENTQPYFLALHYYAKKDYYNALILVQKTLHNKDQRDDSFAYDLWGGILTRKKQYEKAIEKYNESIRINPHNDSPYIGLGYVYYKGYKNYDVAIDYYQKVIKRNPKNYSAYNDLALVLANKGNTKEAIENYKLAIKANPDYANAYYNLGLILLMNKDHKQAIVQFKKIIDLAYNEKNYFNAYNGLCYSLGEEKKYAEAISNCELAIKIKPKDDNIYDTLGSVYMAQKNYPKALVNYQTAVTYNTENGEAHQHLAEVFAIMGKCEQATQQLEWAFDKIGGKAMIEKYCKSRETKKTTVIKKAAS